VAPVAAAKLGGGQLDAGFEFLTIASEDSA